MPERTCKIWQVFSRSATSHFEPRSQSFVKSSIPFCCSVFFLCSSSHLFLKALGFFSVDRLCFHQKLNFFFSGQLESQVAQNLSGSMRRPLGQCGNAKIAFEKSLQQKSMASCRASRYAGKCEKLLIQLFQRSLQSVNECCQAPLLQPLSTHQLHPWNLQGANPTSSSTVQCLRGYLQVCKRILSQSTP